MGDLDMFCNYGKCRKRLTHFAWVTSCSHAFCDSDGQRAFHTEDNPNGYTTDSKKCPACNTYLTKQFDIVKVDVNPSEEFKSMVLTGLRPEILAEIIGRATTFWNYQIYQEYMHQVKNANRSRDSLVTMEKHYDDITNRMKADLQINQKKLKAAHEELETFARNTEVLKERLTEKTRQAQKLQQMVDMMRRKTLTSHLEGQGKSPRNHQTRRGGSSPHPNLPQRPSYTIQPQTIVHNRTPRNLSHNWPGSGQGNAGFHFHPVTPGDKHMTLSANNRPRPDADRNYRIGLNQNVPRETRHLN